MKEQWLAMLWNAKAKLRISWRQKKVILYCKEFIQRGNLSTIALVHRKSRDKDRETRVKRHQYGLN